MAARNAAKKSTPRKAPGRREAKAATTPPSGPTTTVTTPAPAPAPKKGAGGGGGSRKDEIVKYLQAVRAEFNRVTWPGNTNSFTKSLASPEMKAFTAVVLFTLVLFSIYLGFLDWLLMRIFGWMGK